MTIEDLENWLKSAWAISERSGQMIGFYNVRINGVEVTDLTDLRIDHGTNTLELS